MKFKLIIILLLSSNILYSQSENRVTELKEVISNFFDIYLVEFPVLNNVKFIKKPDGYYVVKTKGFYNEIASERFIEAGSNKINDLSLFPKKGDIELPKMYKEVDGKMIEFSPNPREEFYKQEWFFDYARKFPFYGYAGYYNDVIEHYKKIEKPTAKSNYSYCRAWSDKALNMIYENFSNGVKEEQIIFEDVDSKMSVEQFRDLFTVVEAEKKAYRDFKNEYPNYQTKVGDSKMKYAHVVMDGYLKLLYSIGPDKAKEVLESNIYPEEYLEEKRKLLSACPKKSVLYTWGDSDTYPFYYLQAYEGFRTDVTLICVSLTSIPRYVLSCYRGIYNANELKSSFNKNYYSHLKILLSDKDYSKDTCDLNIFFETILNSSNYTLLNQSHYIHLPCSKISVELKSGKFADGNKKVILILDKVTYPDLVSQLNILSNNAEDRSICFTQEYFESGKNPWENYLKNVNGIYILNIM